MSDSPSQRKADALGEAAFRAALFTVVVAAGLSAFIAGALIAATWIIFGVKGYFALGICLIVSLALLFVLVVAFMLASDILPKISRNPPRKVDPIPEPRARPPERPVLSQPSLEDLLLSYLETGPRTAAQLVAHIHRDHRCWYHEGHVLRTLGECARDRLVECSGETWRLVREANVHEGHPVPWHARSSQT